MAGHNSKWSEYEDQKLIALHKTDISIREISKYFNTRSKSGVAGRILILRRRKLLL